MLDRRAFAIAAVFSMLLSNSPALASGQGHSHKSSGGQADHEGEKSQDVPSTDLVPGMREIVVELGDGPAPVVEIGHGERVRLKVHGAGDGQLHFHGYDIEIEAVAGKPVTLDLTADHRGRFPIMTHIHDQLLGDQEKALFYIDIRSR